MESTTKDIWVFIETNADGTPKDVGLELLTPAKQLAHTQGAKLVAVVISADTSLAAQAASHHGADVVLTLEGPAHSADTCTAALSHLLVKYQPLAVLMGATEKGSELAARLSMRLRAGLIANATCLSMDASTGCISWEKRAFGGKLGAVAICRTRPQMGTVQPGIFKKPLWQEAKAQRLQESFCVEAKEVKTRVLETLKEASQEVPLESAELIVTGGRGLGGPEGFELLGRFAKAIGAALGATRAAVEAGWISRAHQVGQTGKLVAPRVYIACGVSGAMQHLAGMSRSETIVAINTNPKANIFSIADYGIVGDLFKVLPILEEELRSQRQASLLAPPAV